MHLVGQCGKAHVLLVDILGAGAGLVRGTLGLLGSPMPCPLPSSSKSRGFQWQKRGEGLWAKAWRWEGRSGVWRVEAPLSQLQRGALQGPKTVSMCVCVWSGRCQASADTGSVLPWGVDRRHKNGDPSDMLLSSQAGEAQASVLTPP